MNDVVGRVEITDVHVVDYLTKPVDGEAWATHTINNEDGPCVIREIIVAESGEATMLEVAEK